MNEKLYKYGNYTNKPITLTISRSRIYLGPNCENYVIGHEHTLDHFSNIGIKKLPEHMQGGIADAKLKSDSDTTETKDSEEKATNTDIPQEQDNSRDMSLENSLEQVDIETQSDTKAALDDEPEYKNRASETNWADYDWHKSKLVDLQKIAKDNNTEIPEKINVFSLRKMLKSKLI